MPAEKVLWFGQVAAAAISLSDFSVASRRLLVCQPIYILPFDIVTVGFDCQRNLDGLNADILFLKLT